MILDVLEASQVRSALKKYYRLLSSVSSSLAEELRSTREWRAVVERGGDHTAYVITDEGVKAVVGHKPYFYVAASTPELLRKVLTRVREAVLFAGGLAYGPEPVKVEYLGQRDVYFFRDGRWVLSKGYVAKVTVANPLLVRFAREPALEAARRRPGDVTVSGFNIKYVVRVSWDLGLELFNARPLYEGSTSLEDIKLPTVTVFDIERLEDDTIIVSILHHRVGEEVRRDDVITLRLPGEEDELVKELSRHRILYGHNIKGFDIPVLMRRVVCPRLVLNSVLDGVEILSTHGNSFQIGASLSLLMVAKVLKGEAGITDEELRVKEEVGGRVAGLPLDKVIWYNRNDVVLTAKIANVILPFVFYVSALTQIPPSVVSTLPAGLIAEYFLFRFWERRGRLIGYMEVEARLEGSKVLLPSSVGVSRSIVGSVDDNDYPLVDPDPGETGERIYHNIIQVDVKMMYPSFVSGFKLDPCCLKAGELPPTLYKPVPSVKDLLSFLDSYMRRDCGDKPLLEAVEYLITVRKQTKKLKKVDPRFKQLDNAVKAVLNALAYGVVGKHGWAPLANPSMAEIIFHGTRAAQYYAFYKLFTDPVLRRLGCRPVYSDTDSYYIACRELNDEVVKVVVDKVNEYLGPFKLEVDLEGVHKAILIYSKKNYVVLAGDGSIVVKGSALRNIIRYYLPPAVTDILPEVFEGRLSEDRVRELVHSKPLEELLIEMHNMLARMLLDTGQNKRGSKNRVWVKTPWVDIHGGYLLRLHPSGFSHPARAPLIAHAYSEYASRGLSNVTIDLSLYSGLEILDCFGYPGWGRPTQLVQRLCGCSGNCIIALVDGKLTCIKYADVKYQLICDGELVEAKTFYDTRLASFKSRVLTGVRIEGLTATQLDERLFREALVKYILNNIDMLRLLRK